jgi:multidrug resistance efflux pump
MNEVSPNGGPSPSLADRVRSLQINDAPPPPRGFAWFPWLLVLILAGVSGYLGYLVLFPAESVPDDAVRAEPMKTFTAGSSASVASSGELAHESRGHIIPRRKIQVSPKVGGMVTKLNFDIGQTVQKGAVLAELETVDYTADRNRAAASALAAKQRFVELDRGMRPEEKKRATAALEEARAMKKEMDDQVKRLRAAGRAATEEDLVRAELKLGQTVQKVIQLEQEEKMMLEGVRKERVEAAKADWDAAEAELAKAQWRLDNCVIHAPVSGVILTKKAEEGDIVNPVAFTLSASLCEMADLSDLEVELKIQERDIAKIFLGQECRIRPEAFPDRLYEGQVAKIIPAADRGIGAVPVRVKVERVVAPKEQAAPNLQSEQGQYLRPDMAAITAFLKKPTTEKKPERPTSPSPKNAS